MFSTRTKRVSRSFIRSGIAAAMLAPLLTFGAQAAMADPAPVQSSSFGLAAAAFCDGPVRKVHLEITNNGTGPDVYAVAGSMSTGGTFAQNVPVAMGATAKFNIVFNGALTSGSVSSSTPGDTKAFGPYPFQQCASSPVPPVTHVTTNVSASCTASTLSMNLTLNNVGAPRSVRIYVIEVDGAALHEDEMVITSALTKSYEVPAGKEYEVLVTENASADGLPPFSTSYDKVFDATPNGLCNTGTDGGPKPDETPTTTPTPTTVPTEPIVPPTVPTVPTVVTTIPPLAIPPMVVPPTTAVPTTEPEIAVTTAVATEPPTYAIPDPADLGIPVRVLGALVAAQPAVAAQAADPAPLAFTGTDSGLLAAIASVLVIGGGGLVVIARRRPKH